MATHARMADPKTPDEGDGGPLKNGTASLEDSDDSSGGVLAKNRVRSPAAGGQHNNSSREMDGFQDGGPPSNRPAAANMEGGYPQSGDQRSQHFPQQQPNFNNNNSGPAEEFRGQEYSNCGGEIGGAYRGGGYEQQHGGQGNCGEMTANSQSGNKMYPQYNSQMRPPFSPRGQQRAPYPGGSRFGSGPSLSQQTGPTPTLNQLLQAPNSLQRYPQQHNSYDYPNQKEGGPGPHHYPGPNNTWSGGGRYPQQHSTMYRNQQGDPSLKRSYPGQMSSPGAQQQPYPQQQYHPYSATPPSQGGPRHNYPQQQYPGVQGPPPTPISTSAGSGYEGAAPRPPSQMGSYGTSGGQSAPPPPQQQAAASQQPPAQHLVPTQQPPASHQQQQQDGCEEAGGSDLPSSTAAPPLRTTPPHPGVSPHRPAPSPSGSSAGSPSMSPALGQPPNIPMPPRPSSTQSESSGQVPQAPAAPPPQGYNQQMAPPGMYGNKMHPNVMGSSHMPPYSPSSHYPQGGYHRAPGSMQVHGYSGQSPNSSGYPGPSYPGQPPQQHRVSNSNYVAPPSTAYNSQPYPSTSPAAASGYNTMNSMMPPPNQYPKSASMPPPPAAGGAQAAAQAAVIAAAASSGNRIMDIGGGVSTARQSPMYLRQHLQQKMYNNSYGGPPEGPPMPPPTSSSSSSQPPCDFASSTIGLPPTTVTQSISSPVPSTVTVSSPSDMMQSPRNSMGPGPPLMDEGSQASNASASSSLPEERVETPKPSSTNHKQQLMSHPATPSALPSPGAASMSSFHDDFESVSSPSWPRTPASPVINNQSYDHHPIKRPDGMLKLYDMSEEPERRLFLDKLIVYQEERGTPLSQCPTISKQPLDLYRLYLAAKERGGFVEVMKGKMWKEIAGLVGIGASSSAAYTLRKQYIKHLLPFECKFDRGGIDPVPLISSLESNSRKKNAKNAGGPMMDGFPGPYPGGYPPNTGPHPGMIPGADYPVHHPSYPDTMHHPGSSMVNHSGSEGAMDPFSDDMQGATPSQYPQRHNSEGGYASYPPPASSTMPPYPGSGPSTSFGYGGGGQQEPPQQPSYSEQYPGTMAPSSETAGGYAGGGRVPPDPYAPPPGGYPPNRTVGPANSSQYPPYQNPCGDQERFGEPQNTAPSPMIRPSTPNSSVIGPSSQQDSSPYPSPHRYPSQPIAGGREAMPPQPMGAYQGRPPLGPSQYPSSQSSGPYTQQDSYGRGGPEFQPQMSRLQSTLIQRLLPKNQSSNQNYPTSQQQGSMYGGAQGNMPPPNKVAPPGSIPGANLYQRGGDMYQMGPKRHTDYAKGHEQYHHYQQQPPPSQAPYSDRSQYPYRPSHGMPPQSAGPPPPQSGQQGWPRDNRSYASAQYPPNQRDNWDMSRHGDSPSQPGSAPWARYGGPQSEPYPHHMGPSLGGPKMMSRNFGPNKMTPHGGPPPQYTPPNQQQRREVIFPPDTVEAVSPLVTKRRRVLAKDISPVDPWRLMMALKSGLLGESTWALDALAILIHDDATVLYFGLGHLQGLLEVLMDHYRRCLNLVFSDLAGDTEVGCAAALLDVEEREKKWYELDRDVEPAVEAKEDVTASARMLDTGGERTVLLDTPNYTHRTRCRKAVRMQEEQALFLFDPDRKWDVHEGFISGSSHWQHGGGEHTGYIQTHFEDTEKRVRFVRVLEDCTKNKFKNSVSKDGRKECGSDTEEDESPNPSSPKSSCRDKCENVDRVSKEPCSKEDLSTESTESVNTTAKNISENSKRTCDSDTQKLDDMTEIGKVSEVVLNSEFPKIRPVSPSRKRRALEDLEDESYTRDEPSLCTMTDAQDSLARRCIAASSILRNLSFVPGNDTEMSKHSGFLLVMGRLLLLHHIHSPRRPPQRHYDREEEGESATASTADSCSSLSGEREWWWDALHIIRENTLVTLANIAGQLDLAPFPEEISFPILDGLMHWVTCPSSHAQDPLPTQPPHSVLSPQRLSLEALSKLSVLESNVDLMMATPPWDRIDRFFALLSKWLSRNEDQVLREFSVVLLSNLSQADSAMARAIALQGACIPLLITFVEQAEQSALQVANAQGINALRENPELMGTTLDMVRRAAGTLRCLARVPSNRTLFLQHQNRLLSLVMSQILDQGVASIVADVLYECSRGEEGMSSAPSEDT